MIKLIKKAEYRVTPWKNGLGLTSEIAIFPENTDFSKSDFLWRLSSAQVSTDNVFSQFSGYDRLLVVLKGAGFILNGTKHELYQPFYFSGDELINCQLATGEVVDLGLIYRRDQVQVNFEVHRFSTSENAQKIYLDSDVAFIFCAEGGFSINQIEVIESETVEVRDCDEIKLRMTRNSVLFFIKLTVLFT